MRFSDLGLWFVLALPLLTSCSVLREEARGTYDPDLIVPGASREVIDAELGSPRLSSPNDSGEVLAIYTTTRVYKGAPGELATQKFMADFLSLGAAELVNGFGLADNTRFKEFHVIYSSASVAESIELACYSTSSEKYDDSKTFKRKITGIGLNTAICGDTQVINLSM